MTDLVSKIDHAIGCHGCGGPLGASPDDLFCSELCQTRWHSTRVDPEWRGFTTPVRSTGYAGMSVLDLYRLNPDDARAIGHAAGIALAEWQEIRNRRNRA